MRWSPLCCVCRRNVDIANSKPSFSSCSHEGEWSERSNHARIFYLPHPWAQTVGRYTGARELRASPFHNDLRLA
jgi:hypothetical protein